MRAILVGGGVSLKEGIEKGLWEQIKLEPSIWSCNYAYVTMPYLPDTQTWVDIDFYKRNDYEMQKLWELGVKMYTRKQQAYAGLSKCITQHESTRDKKNYFGREAIQKNLIYYGGMGLSGMFALSLAIAQGYDEIYLLGYDFGTPTISTKETHYYQKELPHIYSTGVGHPEVYRMNDDTVKREVEDFKIYLNTPNVNIYNVSMISNINYFPKITYEQFFERLKDGR